MSWTLDEYVLKCFPDSPVKVKIARELARFGWQTRIQNIPQIGIKHIGFTAKEIAALIRRKPNDENALIGIRRHLAEMDKYISFIVDTATEYSVEHPSGRPKKRYYLNDYFWITFHEREGESSLIMGSQLVDPNFDQHRLTNERVSRARDLAQKGDRTGIDELIEMLSDDIESIRLNAARELAQLKESRAVGILISMLNDKSDAIRIGAAEALGAIGDSSALDPLKTAEESDPDEFVRKASMGALRNIKKC